MHLTKSDSGFAVNELHGTAAVLYYLSSRHSSKSTGVLISWEKDLQHAFPFYILALIKTAKKPIELIATHHIT